jgi:ATP-dependent protease ClpP protease subunit
MKSDFIISGSINNKLVKRFAHFVLQLDSEDEMRVVINSQGGDENCGRAIAAMIRGWPKSLTVGYGDIYSAAVAIFAAGTRRQLSKYAMVMVHESSSAVDGNSSAIKSTAKQMEEDEKFWCKMLEDFTGTDSKTWMKLHEDETYLKPEDALKLNLATEIL